MRKFEGQFKYLLTTEDCYQKAQKDFRESGFIRELIRTVRKRMEDKTDPVDMAGFIGVVNVDDASEPPTHLPAIAHFAASANHDEVVMDASYSYQQDFEIKGALSKPVPPPLRYQMDEGLPCKV